MWTILGPGFVLSILSTIRVTNGNTVDQMLNQLKNVSFSSINLLEIDAYMQDLEDRYLSPDGQLHKHVTFWLYTRNNPDQKQILKINDPDSIMNSDFSSDKRTVVLVHGWLNAGNARFSQKIKNYYLEEHDYNVICVDWSDLASNLIYPMARFSIKYIGQQIATLLATVVRTCGYDWGEFHLVGHSLGAHVCGIAGENVVEDKIGRITGLDPALPMFGPNPSGRLDATDAAFVDIIHTCGGYLGFYEPCGHVDFYPNGGKFSQPGCGFDLGTCSHTRAYEYFSESLTTDLGFYGRQCNSWEQYQRGECEGSEDDMILMGQGVDESARGSFYLMTANTRPYALGRYSPPPDNELPTSRAMSHQWLKETKDYVRSLITNKAKSLGYKLGLLTNSVYSWFV